MNKSDDIRPRGTVQRTCSLCGWDTWYDPLSPEATKVALVCRSCLINEPCTITCPRCRRRHQVGHRDSETVVRGRECSECQLLPSDAEPPVHFCEALLSNPGFPEHCQQPATERRRHRCAYKDQPDEEAIIWCCHAHANEHIAIA